MVPSLPISRYVRSSFIQLCRSNQCIHQSIELNRIHHLMTHTLHSQLRRASVLDAKPDSLTVSPNAPSDNEFPLPDDDDDAMMPFDDDDEPHRPSLNLTTQTDSTGPASIGGLDHGDSLDHSRKRSSMTQPRAKKRRKIVIDNDHTELSNEHIKAMLAHTGDTLVEPLHPSTATAGSASTAVPRLPFDVLLTRPSLADDGHLAPELLEVWKRNTAKVAGKPFAYPLMEDDDDDDSMEEVRRNESQGEVTDNEPPLPLEEDEDDEPPMPFDDDDAAMPPPDDDDEEYPLVDSPMKHSTGSSSVEIGSPGAFVSLGLGSHNETDETVVSTTSKWHTHTIKVFQLLQQQMGRSDENKLPTLSYEALSQGCNRRIAAGVFLELLQLKTWDYIELNQDESYGDIVIAPGVKYDEPVVV